MTGISLFVLASLSAGSPLPPNSDQARVVQGIGGAMMIPQPRDHHHLF